MIVHDVSSTTELDQSDTAACATLKDHLNGKFGFSIIFVLCKVYFNLKYLYICDVGCGGNSIMLCFLPPPQQN